MKKTLVSLACTLALALGASAQTISFAELPSVRTPTVLPNNFANLDWSGFYYVAPSWVGAEVGFRQGPSELNVAFIGGASCEAAAISCSASISSAASATTEGFRPKSAIVAAGSHSETVRVSAYSHGHFVGSEVYSLTASLQTMNFPPGWGAVTQVIVEATGGTVVFYAFNVESVSASASADVGASAATHRNIAPSAPLGIVDPPPPMDLPTIVEPPVQAPNIIAIGPSPHRAAASPVAAETQPADMMYEPTPSVIQRPSGNAVGKAPPDDLIRSYPNAVHQNPSAIAIGKVQPDDMILKQGANAVQGAQSKAHPDDVVYNPGPSAIGAAQPDDMILKQGANAVQGAQAVNPNATPKAQPDDVVYKPGPSAIGAAQPDDIIYPGYNAVRGAQPVDPNATRKVEPD